MKKRGKKGSQQILGWNTITDYAGRKDFPLPTPHLVLSAVFSFLSWTELIGGHKTAFKT